MGLLCPKQLSHCWQDQQFFLLASHLPGRLQLYQKGSATTQEVINFNLFQLNIQMGHIPIFGRRKRDTISGNQSLCMSEAHSSWIFLSLLPSVSRVPCLHSGPCRSGLICPPEPAVCRIQGRLRHSRWVLVPIQLPSVVCPYDMSLIQPFLPYSFKVN